ncbi:phage protein NinX family protein [uncultured Pseudomonas sp.]|uniref:phage protein NinX family protein n=1 Tax=uncultured Pseudomonas sp. TaxID=114707 RepID=UPI0030D6FD51
MNDFYEVKTVDLVGAALDWAVANAVGLPLCEEACQGDFILIGHGDGDLERFAPSTDWSQCGPLRDKYKVCVFDAGPQEAYGNKEMVAATLDTGFSWIDTSFKEAGGVGETAPIAICRAVVRHESGDVVRVPAELIGNANPL